MTAESRAEASPAVEPAPSFRAATWSVYIYAVVTPATLVTLMLGLAFNQPFFEISEWFNWTIPVLQVIIAVGIYRLFRSHAPSSPGLNLAALLIALVSSTAEFVRVTLVYIFEVVQNFGLVNELLRVGGGAMWLWFLLLGLLAQRSQILPRKWATLSFVICGGWMITAWGTLFQELALIKIVMGVAGVPMGLILIPLWCVWLGRELRAIA